MACSPKGCNCSFQSETLTISVDGGVVTIEQAEFTDITEMQDDIAALQAAVAALTTTVSDGFAAQTAALAAAVAFREPVRLTGTATARAAQTALLVTNSVSIPAETYARYVIVDITTHVSKTVAADVVSVRARYNAANVARYRITGTVGTSELVWAGIIPASTAAVIDVTVERDAGGAGTYTTVGGGADNRLDVSTFALS